jgi:dTDP-4-dehydrorhamnose reductase
MMSSPPEVIQTEAQLEEFLTTPGATLVDFIKTVPGPLLVLGAGGKMGPTLAVLARRAAEIAGHKLNVIAVSRFTDAQSREWLEARGVQTRSCDLLNARAVGDLPDSPSILYLVGLKFGTAQNPGATWAMNTIVPARVTERFRDARIVALSTGNVYPFSELSRGGSLENDPLTPLGEYGNAAIGRERIFEFYSRSQEISVAQLRLFYAVELRYGVLVDIAQKVYAGEAIDLANGYFNCIWQGDANEMVVRSLALCATPPAVYNLCRPEVFSVRDAANRLGALLNKTPHFHGKEAATALLGNAKPICARLGEPAMKLDQMLQWIAHWVAQGGRNLNRPTHFEVRDGKY